VCICLFAASSDHPLCGSKMCDYSRYGWLRDLCVCVDSRMGDSPLCSLRLAIERVVHSTKGWLPLTRPIACPYPAAILQQLTTYDYRSPQPCCRARHPLHASLYRHRAKRGLGVWGLAPMCRPFPARTQVIFRGCFSFSSLPWAALPHSLPPPTQQKRYPLTLPCPRNLES
jgi:hypothetical protein